MRRLDSSKLRRDGERVWFSEPPGPASLPPSVRPPPAPTGSVGSAAAFGAIGGGIGGAAMLAAARTVGHFEHVPRDFAGDLARRVTPSALGGVGSAEVSGLISMIAIGALTGLLLGLLTRHLLRVLPRILFFVLFMPIVWVLIQAFVIRHFAPALESRLPILPLTLGAAAYGVCLALARPLRAR